MNHYLVASKSIASHAMHEQLSGGNKEHCVACNAGALLKVQRPSKHVLPD
jgi:hypothetical protein